MTSYQIRPVSKDDLDEVVELCALHAAYEKADYDPTGKKEKLARLIFSREEREISSTDLFGSSESPCASRTAGDKTHRLCFLNQTMFYLGR